MVTICCTVIKASHNSESKELSNIESISSSLSTKTIWRLGALSFVVGSCINFASFAFAAQSLLAALGGVQFISNVFFSRFILNERLTSKVIFATCLIIIGLTCAVNYSNHANTSYTREQLLNLYDAEYRIFLLIFTSILVSFEVIYVIYTFREAQDKPLVGSQLIRPILYAFVSATIGTQSVLQSKCLAELIKVTVVNGENQFLDWPLYAILGVLVTGLSFWLYRLNNALKLFDGILIIPLLQVS